MSTASSKIPPRLSVADEGLHAPPPEASDRLFADTVWLSAIAPDSGVWGISQMHIATNRGYGRFQSLFWIDGVGQMYTGKQIGGLDYGQTRWSDGAMSYEVLEPFEAVRLTLDNPRFAFDLTYTARHPAFDYDDCVGGSPLDGLKPAAGVHGGHYEQAMQATGTFEIRGGPRAGEARSIDTLAHRDHTWSDRFSGPAPWQYPEGKRGALHYWLVLQFPSRNINVTGFYDLSALGISRPIDRVGGFESTTDGTRPVVSCVADPGGPSPTGPEGFTRFRIGFADGETVHVRATHTETIAKLRMLGEDDTESRLNDYERFCSLVIEETGEEGHGVLEHSTLPPEPRWLV
jgi:hypothetical protein